MGRQVADLIEEKRSLMGLFEAADAALIRASKGAAFVSEQFAFQQVFRNGRAIDGDERGFTAVTVLVDGACDQFLAGAGLAANEDRDGLGGDASDFLAHVLHGAAGADQGGATGEVVGCGAGGQGDGFAHQASGLGCAMKQRDELGHFKGLLKIVVGADLGGFDGGFDIAVGGHQDNGQAGLSGVELAQEGQAVQSGQAQIGQDDITIFLAGAAQPLIAAGAKRDLKILFLQDGSQVGGQAGIVFDEQDVWGCHHEVAREAGVAGVAGVTGAVAGRGLCGSTMPKAVP
jgi:hypothetical protein